MTILTAEEPSNNDLLNELRDIQEKIKAINSVKEEVKGLTEKLDSARKIVIKMFYPWMGTWTLHKKEIWMTVPTLPSGDREGE